MARQERSVLNQVKRYLMDRNFLQLTPKAVLHLDRVLRHNPDFIGVHLGLKKSGCAGYMYILDPVSEVPSKSQVFKVKEITFYVDTASISLLSGSVLDYKVEGLETKAFFINPHVTDACGCGDSVELKEK